MLGIVGCECGYPINNHFEHGKRPCAFGTCKAYKQRIYLPNESLYGKDIKLGDKLFLLTES